VRHATPYPSLLLRGSTSLRVWGSGFALTGCAVTSPGTGIWEPGRWVVDEDDEDEDEERAGGWGELSL
jgi:hypothetical protein